ncbi:major facilitator superfamily domain-containing protein [Mycena rosella]|uniref:Major facilitator superfamily domain-containing protein n=1 Tax=Mycena rosella TaxID=1033263 RepID=A0AAD7CT80_MYCRO|nr:major facilitator superfamily domain-containing protein [Mycena rosella]
MPPFCSKGGDVIVLASGPTNLLNSTNFIDVRRKVRKPWPRCWREESLPIPSDSPADPLNWPSCVSICSCNSNRICGRWKKNIILYIVSIHAMQGPFSAAIVVPSLQQLAAELKISLSRATYIVSVQIICLGVMPLFWSPVASRIGRRPVYLISALGSAAFALTGAYCHSYRTLLVTRAFQSIFISSAQSLGGSTVGDLFFAYQKGRKMGVWVLLVTIGPILGPLIVGFLVQDKGWRSAFYLLAAIHLALFFAHLFFGPETLYLNRRSPGEGYGEKDVAVHTGWHHYVSFQVFDRRPISVQEIFRPLAMVFRPVVLLPALAYSITFCYTNVMMTILIPQLFGENFHLTPGQMSLQFISLLVGAVLGEQIAGYGSDVLVNWRTKRAGGRRVPEFRLILATPGFLLAIIGVIIWGIQLQNGVEGKWNVTPDIGSAIAIFGQQLVTTVCVTYAIESYLEDTATFRQLYAFTAPFYFPIAFDSLGEAKASGLFAGIIGLGMLLVIACNVWGPAWRGKRVIGA